LALQSKMTLVVALGGLFAMLGGFVYYASLDNPELEKAEVELKSVELVDVNSITNSIKLKVIFLVKNPSEKTFTVPIIAYKLYSDGEFFATGQYSTEDIAMPGRAAFYPGSEIALTNTISVELSDENAQGYNAIVSGENSKFSAEGTITVETAWSIVEKEFQTSM